MSEFNDYKWYDEESKNSNTQGEGHNFYTEVSPSAKEIKKEKRKKRMMAALAGVMTVIMLASVSTTAYVLNNAEDFAGGKTTSQNTKTTKNQDASFSFSQLSDSERTPMSTVDIATKVGPAVVGISCVSEYRSFFGQTYEQEGSGSGIIVSSDGYVVTNNHVIEGVKSVKVVLNTGKEYEAKIVGADTKTDLAVLKIEAEDLTVATLGDSSACQVGELAVAIGNPLGQELAGTVTVGVISAVNRSIQTSDDGTTMNLLQTDAAINPGNSGGALVNAYGEVIGINSMKFSGNNVEGIGFAIPINDAKPVVSDLIAGGYVKGRPLIGISIKQISPEIAAINDLPAGLYVADVSVGGAAEKAGIKKGDVIIAVDGKIVETAKEVNAIRDTHQAGDTMKFEISRDGENMTVDVVLQEDTTSRTSN